MLFIKVPSIRLGMEAVAQRVPLAPCCESQAVLCPEQVCLAPRQDPKAVWRTELVMGLMELT